MLTPVSSHRRRAAVSVLVLLPLVAVTARSGDGGSPPAAPNALTVASGVANISGNWSGTSDWEQRDIHTIANVTMSITQDDRAVSGSIIYASPAYQGWSGSINGTVAGTAPDTQFVGTIELRAPAAAGTGSCAGTAVFSGRSASTSLRWDTSQLDVVAGGSEQVTSACRGLLRSVVLIMERG